MTKRHQRRATRNNDLGATLVEVVIAIVLLGSIVGSGLTLLSATINSTVMDRDHSNGHAWLQTAADMLYARVPENCDPTLTGAAVEARRQAIMDSYEDTIQETNNPEDWPEGNITVEDLWYWHLQRGTDSRIEEGWVYDRCTTDLQRLQLRVRNADGRIVEEVQVIIGGG